jgi:dihydroorotase
MLSVVLGLWPHPTSAPPPVLRLADAPSSSREVAKALTLDHLVRLMHTEPVRIFNLEDIDCRRGATVDVAAAEHPLEETKSKCAWSPYTGWTVRGAVVPLPDVE